ncbi:MAG: LysM peptidoglycan-binding domain-containing protein, partial [Phycisphaeraceae bacterium]
LDPAATPPAEDPGIMDDDADAAIPDDAAPDPAATDGLRPGSLASRLDDLTPAGSEPDPTAGTPAGTTPRTAADPTAASDASESDASDEPDLPRTSPREPAADRDEDETGRTTPSTDTPARPTTYTVAAGDTLISIADELYGDARYWEDLAHANPTVDPLRLRIGQELRLPSRQIIERRRAADTDHDLESPPAPGTLTHIVRPGETLSTIAQRHYSDSSRWRVIFNANRDRLGNDPDRITAGDELTIPPLPRN